LSNDRSRDWFHRASGGRLVRPSKFNPVVGVMNKSIGVQLIVYGLLVAGLSYAAHQLAPSLARPSLIVGLAGGGLCLVWGLRALAGSRRKAMVILTLVPVNFVLLSQVVLGWLGESEAGAERRLAATAATVALALSLAMLMRVAYTDAELVGPPANPDATNKTPAPPSTRHGAPMGPVKSA